MKKTLAIRGWLLFATVVIAMQCWASGNSQYRGPMLFDQLINLKRDAGWLIHEEKYPAFDRGVAISNHQLTPGIAQYFAFRVGVTTGEYFIGFTDEDWIAKKEDSRFGFSIKGGQVYYYDGDLDRETAIPNVRLNRNNELHMYIQTDGTARIEISRTYVTTIPFVVREKLTPMLTASKGELWMTETNIPLKELKPIQFPGKLDHGFEYKSTGEFTSSANWASGGQVASHYLPIGGDGILRFKGTDDRYKRYYGFSYKKKVEKYEDFQYCIRTSKNGLGKYYYVFYVNGGGKASREYQPGDEFVIIKRRGNIELWFNNSLDYRASIDNELPIFTHILPSNENSVFEDVEVFMPGIPVAWDIEKGIEQDQYNTGGLKATSVEENDDMSTRLAFSKKSFGINDNCRISFQVERSASPLSIGFAVKKEEMDDDQDYEHILTFHNEKVNYFENGVLVPFANQSNFKSTHNVPDRFEIIKTGRQLEFIKNGTVMHQTFLNTALNVSVVASLGGNNSISSVVSNFTWDNPVQEYDPNQGYLTDYAIPVRKPDGNYYKFKTDVRFVYEEEYNVHDKKLECYFYDNTQQKLDCPNVQRSLGDNRVQVSLSGECDLTSGEYYMVELINDKNEKRYFRFLYDDGSPLSNGGVISISDDPYIEWIDALLQSQSATDSGGSSN